MKITKRTILSLCLCLGIIFICFILISLTSGFRHEYKKSKQFLLTLIAILFIRYIFLDHITFFVQAFLKTKCNQSEVFIDHKHEEVDQEKSDHSSNPLGYMKLQLKSLQYQMRFDPRHQDEALNLEYKQLTEELWFFGKYFVLLLLVVVNSRNSHGYYNTAIMRRILNESYFSEYKLHHVMTINDLYYWINDTVTDALNEGYDYDGKPIDEPGWVRYYMSKLLGVVRLRQLRLAKKGKPNLHFDNQDYLPKWLMFNHSLPYMDKYWRIYYPWKSQYFGGLATWFSYFLNIGMLYPYTENKGYITLLARDRKNSAKILQFLQDNNWLDDRTAVVFIDFTLYNSDSNMFTICSVIVENTPFGNLAWQVNVQSAQLLWNLNEISLWGWLLVIVYGFQIIQFCKLMIIRYWFTKEFFTSRWNHVDFAIVLLNILYLIFNLIRESYIRYVMHSFVLSKKMEFVDFRVACVYDKMTIVTLGFLVCLAFIRIWKLLQFSKIFCIFNRTLYTAGVPLISTLLGIYILISAIGLAAQILNGSYTEIFSNYAKTVVSIMTFSFGFSSRTNPEDLNHGGGFLGFILYLILMFVVAIFLINMYITLICDHFANARLERDQESPDKLTYWEFLKMEYSFVKEYFQKAFSRAYTLKNQTVKSNIEKKIDELNLKLEKQQVIENSRLKNRTEDEEAERYMQRANRIQQIAAVLNLQLEILKRQIMVQSLDWDSDNEDIIKEFY